MKTFKIGFWFRYDRANEKDYDVETIESTSFKKAVEKLKAKYPSIHIFKTEMKLCSIV